MLLVSQCSLLGYLPHQQRAHLHNHRMSVEGLKMLEDVQVPQESHLHERTECRGCLDFWFSPKIAALNKSGLCTISKSATAFFSKLSFLLEDSRSNKFASGTHLALLLQREGFLRNLF